MNVFLLIVIVLAAARATHLLADDYILSKPRNWLVSKLENHPHLKYLPTCTWCTSIWIGILADWPAHVWAQLSGPVLWILPLAISYTTVLLEGVAGWLSAYPEE